MINSTIVDSLISLNCWICPETSTLTAFPKKEHKTMKTQVVMNFFDSSSLELKIELKIYMLSKVYYFIFSQLNRFYNHFYASHAPTWKSY